MKKILTVILTLAVLLQPCGNVVLAEPIQGEEQLVTVTFTSGTNGTIEGTASFRVQKGSTWSSSNITVPRIRVDSGYSFSHWDPEFPSQDAVITEDLTFTAIYTGSSYTANNDAEAAQNGGEVSIPEEEVPTGELPVNHTTPWWAYILIGIGIAGLLCVLTILVREKKDEEKEEIRHKL